MPYHCDECGRDFDSKRSRSIHQTSQHNDVEWRNREWLEEHYVEKEWSTYKMAEKANVSDVAIQNALDDFDINKRTAGESLTGNRTKSACYISSFQGKFRYPSWTATNGKYDIDHMTVHRLLAVSEFGIEAVKDKHVHHINNVPWDNRPENIELLDPGEHLRQHALERGLGTEVSPHND